MKRERKRGAGALRNRQLVIINRPFVTPQRRCERCTEPSGMITPDEAAALCEVSTRTVYHWLETGSIHFLETDGALLICLLSLAATSTLAATPAQLTPKNQ